MTSLPGIERGRVHNCLEECSTALVRQEIRDGLLESPRRIASKYFYDARGSDLFDQICELPEYYPTRTERRLLQSIAPQVANLTQAEELVELGSGSASKTGLLLDALQSSDCLRRYVPLDVSESTVREVAERFTCSYKQLLVHGIVADFMLHLDCIPTGTKRLFVFLGGTVGNLTPRDAEGFLSRLARTMVPGEYFLLGTDLIKDVARLECAYNDSAGVTEEFNRNSLRVINRLSGADFDPAAFEHRAFYEVEKHRIEMRLRARSPQTVRLTSLDLEIDFEQGEEILTEISTKFDRDLVEGLLEASGFSLVEWFTDSEQLFGLSLARRCDSL